MFDCEATAVHGIDDEDVAVAPRFAEIADEVLGLLRGRCSSRLLLDEGVGPLTSDPDALTREQVQDVYDALELLIAERAALAPAAYD